jgi:hypothetical protein
LCCFFLFLHVTRTASSAAATPAAALSGGALDESRQQRLEVERAVLAEEGSPSELVRRIHSATATITVAAVGSQGTRGSLALHLLLERGRMGAHERWQPSLVCVRGSREQHTRIGPFILVESSEPSLLFVLQRLGHRDPRTGTGQVLPAGAVTGNTVGQQP